MCIIAIKPKGVSIPVQRLKYCWKANSDGAGFMYAEDGKLNIVKGLMTFDSFLAAYDKVKPTDKKIVIHFRFGTHGDVCPNLTHPFSVNKELALVHNGIFSNIQIDDPFELENKVEPKDLEEYIKAQEEIEIDDTPPERPFTEDELKEIDGKYYYEPKVINGEEIAKEVCDTSDSLEFCKILKKLPKKFLSNKALFFLVNGYIANENSVVVFMDNFGNVNITGINSHIVKDGVWYSNMDYTEPRKFKKIFTSQDIDSDIDSDFDGIEQNKEPIEEKGLNYEDGQCDD